MGMDLHLAISGSGIRETLSVTLERHRTRVGTDLTYRPVSVEVLED
jgi:hypothetical protein